MLFDVVCGRILELFKLKNLKLVNGDEGFVIQPTESKYFLIFQSARNWLTTSQKKRLLSPFYVPVTLVATTVVQIKYLSKLMA